VDLAKHFSCKTLTTCAHVSCTVWMRFYQTGFYFADSSNFRDNACGDVENDAL